MPGEFDVSEGYGFSLKKELAYTKKMGKPGFKLVGALEAVLAAAYADTQARTHVITGSLKSSGKTDSDFDGETWTGTIKYGGVSAGVNNPVEYAIYEMARGGEHDFFGGLPEYDGAFEAAVAKHMVP